MRKEIRYYCPSCGQEIIQTAYLMTHLDVCRLTKAHRDVVVEDEVYKDKINDLGSIKPSEKHLKQIVFSQYSDLSADYKKFIHRDDKGYFYELSGGGKDYIRSKACVVCHANITNVLEYDKQKSVLLVGQPSSSKTCCTVSAIAVSTRMSFDTDIVIQRGFCPHSYEEEYYDGLVEELTDYSYPLVPKPTEVINDKISRQPLAFFSMMEKSTGYRTLLTMIDYPGEVIKNGSFITPEDSVIALFVDGSKSLNHQIDFLSTQVNALDHHAGRYVIVVTKCDLLEKEGVENIMLVPFSNKCTIRNFSDLAVARRCQLRERLKRKYGALGIFYNKLSEILRKRVDVVFCSALGCGTNDDRTLIKNFNPLYMIDLLLTFADDD